MNISDLNFEPLVFKPIVLSLASGATIQPFCIEVSWDRIFLRLYLISEGA